MANWISKIFSKVEGFFESPKLVSVEATIEALAPAAMAIVQDINVIAPNRTLAEINAVATKYALPTITALASNPQAAGNTLLNLATTILQKNNAPTASISLLNTVVQLAVTAEDTQT